MHTKTLREYLDGIPRGAAGEFAARLGISKVYLYQLAAGQDGRQPSVRLAVRIEAETQGVVRCWTLRPDDWWHLWPAMASHQGAPPIPEAANDEAASRLAA